MTGNQYQQILNMILILQQIIHHLWHCFNINNYWHYFDNCFSNKNNSNINCGQYEYILKKDIDHGYHSSSGSNVNRYDFGSGLIKLIKIFNKWYEINAGNKLRVIIDDNHYDAIRLTVLESMQLDFISNIKTNQDTMSNRDTCTVTMHKPPAISLFSLVVAKLNFTEACLKVLRSPQTYISQLITDTFKQHEIEQLLENLIPISNWYIDANDFRTPSWGMLFQRLLFGCSDRFLVSNANLWFPIIYRATTKNSTIIGIRKREWNQFVFDKIISKFNFGLYLVDFITYVQDG